MAEIATGMAKQEMKALLMKSKKEPVNCAFGQGAEATCALLLLHRVKGPKAIEKDLEKQFPAAKNTWHGTAVVDINDDPKQVKLLINKPCSGMARKLVRTLKGTGFTKVVILLVNGEPVESYSEQETEAAATSSAEAAEDSPASPPPPTAPAPDAAALRQALAGLIGRIQGIGDPAQKAALAKLAAEANMYLKSGTTVEANAVLDRLQAALEPPQAASAEVVADIPEAPPPPQFDAAALRQTLAGLIGRIAGVADPARRASIAKLAGDANAALKAGDLAVVESGIDGLRAALAEAASGAQPAATPNGSAVKYAKSRLAWLAARQKVESEINALRGQILNTLDGYDFGGDLASDYANFVSPVLAALDESLADKLDEAGNTIDVAARAQRIAEARTIMQGYESYLNGAPVLAALDDNPFLPLSIRATLSRTLAALSSAVV